jgi:hypothetical protein
LKGKKMLFSMEWQEEISRFISRFDCLTCLLLLRYVLLEPPFKMPHNTQETDTNSIELKTQEETEKKYLKSKIVVCARESEFGKIFN